MYSMNNGPEKVQLSIANVSESDNGTWRCTMEVSSSRAYDCNPDQEKPFRRKDSEIQLIVVSKFALNLLVINITTASLLVPPSEPRYLHVVEKNSSSIHVCWNQPFEHGSPYLAGYELCYNNNCEYFGVRDCAEVKLLSQGNTYNITVYAISKSGNVSAKSPPSNFINCKRYTNLWCVVHTIPATNCNL